MESHVFLIGDQTHDLARGFRDLLQADGDVLLQDFFLKSFYRLRTEVSKLRDAERARIPRFSTWADLVSLRSKKELYPPLDQALACAYQLGTFIRQCGENDGVFPSSHESCLVGLCTGALASSAICCSRTLTELIPIGIDTVVVAFRTGLRAAEVAASVEATEQLTSWSAAYAGTNFNTASEALEKFADKNDIPRASRPYVSASSEQGVTISGPPSVLDMLRKNSEFSHLRSIPMPLYAPYHAPHLFSTNDVSSIMECMSDSPYKTRVAYIPIFSGATGDFVNAETYGSLLEASLNDILLEPLRWDLVSPKVVAEAPAKDDGKIKLHSISTSLARSLARSLQTMSDVEIVSNDEGVVNTSVPRPMSEDSPSLAHNPSRSKIAIVGMSGRFPGAEDPNAFWDLLHDGLDVHKVVPARSWDVKTHVDPTLKKKNTMATPYGCWLDRPELFDNKFFNISPREAPQIDPAQRMALMTAYEAMEQAGIVPDGSPSTQKDRVGIFYGCTSQDWMETNSAQNIDTYLIPGGNRAFIPGRINYSFKFSGPSLSIDTACSSSLAAINVACLSLWRGDTDAAIAGGTNVLTNPDFSAGLDRGHFLSRTGNCKTFDDTADGYCRGEGVGTVILKRLEDAIAENDPIQGVILGAYTNHSAEAESITRPHVGAQRDIFKKILDHRSIDPYDVSYIEMHGTGTQAGDASEMSSVLDTFAPAAAKKRRDDQKLYLGSAKANIGHGESVSGVSSLAKVLLMMKHNTIPPHVGIKTKINHRFPTDLDERKVFIAKNAIPWDKPEEGLRKVFLNNFSAAGGNTALLLEDAPPVVPKKGVDPRSIHAVVASARCAASVKGNVQSIISSIDEMVETDNALAQLSYTTTARRMQHAHRVIVRGSSLAEIKTNLQGALERNEGATRPKAAPKILFTFTGQGSQYPGMGKQLFEQSKSFRTDINRFDQIAQTQGFCSFKEVITADGGEIGDYPPMVVQLANVCLEMALLRFWNSLGIKPAAVVGHSLGEYGALNAAGVLSEADTIYLVGRRAQLLQDLCSSGTHSMLAVKASPEDVLSRIEANDNSNEIACINSTSDVVISGKASDIVETQKELASEKVRSTTLKVPYAFHSSQVDPVIGSFEDSASGITFMKPTVPVLCPLTGEVVTDTGFFGASYLAKHCREPVNMVSALKAGKSQGILTESHIVLEIGPHPVVSGMVKAALGPSAKVFTTLQRGKDTWATVTETVSSLYSMGLTINWNEYHRDFKNSHRVVPLPAYSWDMKPFWMQYVHDWSLRKGDEPLKITAPAAGTDPSKHPLESTTIHRVVEEKITEQGGTLIVEADIARADLNPFVMGHKVNDVPLCTPSVYADMAWSMGKYLLDHHRPNLKQRLIDVSDMVLERALVARPGGPQYVRCSGKIDWSKNSMICQFLSVDANGKTTAKHSQCNLVFKDESGIKPLQKAAEKSKQRIKSLYDGLASCKTFRFSRNMAYKAVSSLAKFDENYQAMTEVVLDNEKMEAASVVDLKDVKKGGSFNLHPAHIDSLSQAGGFVMNCNDKANLDVDIFVNHGWRSFQLFEKLSIDKVYRTHVQMEPTVDKMWEGDVSIYEGEKLVGMFGKVILQGVPRRLMNMILKQEMGSKAPGGAKAKPAPAAAPTQAKSQPKAQPAAAPKAASKAPASAPAPAAAAEPQNQSKVFDIILEESGLAAEDLTDSSTFSDLGVDSLLGMIITGRMKEELDIEIESSEFLEFSSIGDLKAWLGKKSGGSAPAAAPEAQVEAPQPPTESEPAPAEEPATQEPAAQESAVQKTSAGNDAPSAPSSETFDQILAITAEESGIAVEELTDDTSFADIGVDSLLAMLVVGRCQEELPVEFDIQTVFANSDTIGALRSGVNEQLGGSPASADAEPQRDVSSSSSSTSGEEKSSPEATTPITEQSEDDSDSLTDETPDASKKQSSTAPVEKVRPTSSVLLQGRPKTSTKTLFLFPDGSGSASSYTHLANIDPDWMLIGLNCPYVRHPEEFKCTLDQLIGSYLDEIRRRQPEGPYRLGGWSAGGILAYRAAQELIQDGQQVTHLLLMDSPVPKGLDKLPQRFMDHCDDIGVWSHAMPGKNTSQPKWLVPHFNATMDCLGDYFADPLPEDKVPKTSLIWAAECIMDGINAPKLPPGEDDVEDMKFLSEKRTDFTDAGWAVLFPGTTVTVDAAYGANHFSMMQGDHGPKLSAWIKNALQ